MKKLFLYLLPLLALGFASCSEWTYSESSPIIYLYPRVRTNVGDTLRCAQVESNIFRMDTIAVGDTVQFYVQLYSQYNTLVDFRLDWDEGAMAIVVDSLSALRPGLTDASRPEEGYMVFTPGTYSQCIFPMRYIALEKGKYDLTFQLRSDAKKYSSSTLTLQQPVR